MDFVDDDLGGTTGIFGDAFTGDPDTSGEDEALGLGESFDESIDADDHDQCVVMGECDGCHSPVRVAFSWDEVASALAGRAVEGVALRGTDVVWSMRHGCPINGTVRAATPVSGIRATYKQAYGGISGMPDDQEYRIAVVCPKCSDRIVMAEEWQHVRNALRGSPTSPECQPVPLGNGRYSLLLLGQHCNQVLRVPVEPAAIVSAALRVKAGLR